MSPTPAAAPTAAPAAEGTLHRTGASGSDRQEAGTGGEPHAVGAAAARCQRPDDEDQDAASVRSGETGRAPLVLALNTKLTRVSRFLRARVMGANAPSLL